MKPTGYLEELRRAVGKRLLIVPGACVVIRSPYLSPEDCATPGHHKVLSPPRLEPYHWFQP